MASIDRSTSDQPGWFARAAPMGRRLRSEAGGAGLLLAATILALAWANSPWGDSYRAFWGTELSIQVGGSELALDLQHWVNDGLMALFFFVVGLEVKRELVLGGLADRRRAAVPLLAALAGLALPALVYIGFNLGDEAASAWAVVISTDTAFLIGVLALLGSACPPQLRVFLLALAITDDVGALTVIALFYTEDLSFGPLVLAIAGVLLMLALRWLKVWRGPAYLVLAVFSWVALYSSGVHATLLGVTIALITPAYAPRRQEVDAAAQRARAYLQSPSPEFADAARLSIARSVPPGERLQQLWRPWTSMVIVPLFALANAGVPLTGDTLRAALVSPITLGVVAGLVLGKLIGILLGATLAVRLRLGDLGPGLSWGHLAGGAALSGIGFTISLFIVDLAFDDEASADQARVGVLTASVVATLLGSVVLRLVARRQRGGNDQRNVLEPSVDPERDHIRGPLDAPLTLVEYGDFECPFCSRATGAMQDLHDQFGDQFRYVFRHSPLPEVHPHARLAAEASEAAAAQGQFWEMHDRLFAAQDQLSSTDLLDHAAALNLDVQRFARDLGSGRYTRRVQDDLESAQASGVNGTPTFFIGGFLHSGPFDAGTLAAALLAAAGMDAAPEPRRMTGGGAFPLLRLLQDYPGQDRSTVKPVPPSSLPETPDRGGDHPRLTDDQLVRLERAGTRLAVSRGDILYRPGDPDYDFHVVLSGAVAVFGQLATGYRPVIRVHEGRRFLGELDLFSGQPVSRTAQVIRDGEVLRLTLEQLQGVFGQDQAFREQVLRAFLVRRAMRLESTADLRILDRTDSPGLPRLLAYAAARRLTTDVVELGADEGGRRLLADVGATESDLPVVASRTGRVFYNPDDAELDRELGFAGD